VARAARIHVLSAHYKSARWLSLQLRCLEAFALRPYRLAWSLEGISLAQVPRRRPQTASVVSQSGEHADKLNALAEQAVAEARDDDVLMFLDGDALPVARLDAVVDLARSGRLVAVRRDENDGDPQPHPSFCVVSAGLWREIEGDWAPGPVWLDCTGAAVTDVGARLGQRLKQRGIGWTPLLRTVHHDLHPLWFGVYGDLIYHHGAAFRFPRSRADAAESALHHQDTSGRETWLAAAGEHNQALGDRVYARLARLKPESILARCQDGAVFAGLDGVRVRMT
jgi:hypothetical protein